jgi:cell pole-organizing protein PopZ
MRDPAPQDTASATNLASGGTPIRSSPILDLIEETPPVPQAGAFDLTAPPAEAAPPEAAPAEAAPAEPADKAAPAEQTSVAREEERGRLVSSATSAAVDSAFNALAQTVLVHNARTLEDLVREMLRPMLKVWLDDNLPGVVERLVRGEIERVSRGSGG